MKIKAREYERERPGGIPGPGFGRQTVGHVIGLVFAKIAGRVEDVTLNISSRDYISNVAEGVQASCRLSNP